MNRNGVRGVVPYAIGLALLTGYSAALAEENGRHQLDFHGYVRTGVGTSKDGKTQAEFKAPGAQSKYRLGNEAHTNFELALDYRYKLDPEDTKDGAYVQTYFMADDYENFGESGELGLDRVAQAYVNFANFLSPGVSAWVGRRYYDRKSIHLNNHYWLNAGQGAHAGAGIEGLSLGPGKLKLAVFRMEDENVRGRGDLSGNTGTLNSTSLDLRFSDLAVNKGGTLTLWGQGVHRAAQDALGFEAKTGYGLGAWHDQKGVLGGSNTFAVTYRKGAAVVQGTFNPNPVREDQGYDLDDASAWEVNNNFLMEPNDRFSMQWGALARLLDFGQEGAVGSKLRWYSTGVRPIYYFNDHVNLATEFGVDYVDDEYRDLKGSVRKFTVALQLSKSRGYYSRPVLRLFFTKAAWSEEFKGQVGATPGDAPYGDVTEGWTAGVQLETSW